MNYEKIHFEDHQQDLLWLIVDTDDVDESGLWATIVDAGPYHRNLYVNKKCGLTTKEGKQYIKFEDGNALICGIM